MLVAVTNIHFPLLKGIIAPKIEISTKTTIEETLCTQQHKKCSAFVVNPKLVASNLKTRPPRLRQKKVCHSLGYHKARKYPGGAKEKTKPPFQYRRADDRMLLRTPKGLDRRDSIRKCRCKIIIISDFFLKCNLILEEIVRMVGNWLQGRLLI